MKDFLRKIRDKNHGRHVLVFADNFPAHRAKEVSEFAESIGITILLSLNIPDLNPIEFI